MSSMLLRGHLFRGADQDAPVALDDDIGRLAAAAHNLIGDVVMSTSSSRQLVVPLLGKFHDLHGDPFVPLGKLWDSRQQNLRVDVTS